MNSTIPQALQIIQIICLIIEQTKTQYGNSVYQNIANYQNIFA